MENKIGQMPSANFHTVRHSTTEICHHRLAHLRSDPLDDIPNPLLELRDCFRAPAEHVVLQVTPQEKIQGVQVT